MKSPSNVHLRATAEQDIADIYAFYSLHAPDIAQTFLKEIDRHLHLLGRFPDRGRKCRFNVSKLQQLRFMPLMHPVARYLLFYEVKENQVIVVAVLHGRRDLIPLFEREKMD